MADYYSTLGLAKGASLDEIKKSYRKLALQFHPDRNQGNKDAEEKFKKISEAYAVLSDPEKKKQYDMFGDQKFHQNYSTEDIFRGTDFSSIFREFDLGGDSFFSKIFGGGFGGMDGSQYYTGGGRRAGSGKGQDVEYPITVTFMDAYKGVERNVSYRLNDGSTQDFKLRIPPGVRDGAKLRVQGKGAQSPYGGQPGDLYVVVSIAAHPTFSRNGDDIEAPVSLKITEALLGSSKDVETPEGSKKIKIPAGVKPGTKIRLKGLGFSDPANKSARGDMYAVVEYDIPAKLNKSQQDAIQQLSDVGL